MDLAIIADDLTGAILVGASLEAEGTECPVVIGAPEAARDERSPIVIFATRTRLAPAADAVATVADILVEVERNGAAPQVAYKVCASFDSTDDGNIGPVADLFLARYGETPLLLSAGFPRYGTTVHQGYLFYRGRLVSESIKRHDPLTPMSDPDLVRTISRQTNARVGLIPHVALRTGEAHARALVEQLAEEGHSLLLIDCSDDEDAKVGAHLTLGRRATIGSDAHVMALASLRAAETSRAFAPPARHAAGPGAAIFGSVGPVANAQIEAFEREYPVLRIDLTEDAGTEAIVGRCLDWAGPRIGDRPLGVTTAPEDIGRISQAQERFGMLGSARRAEAILAGVARGLVERGVVRLAVAGGETSGAVAEALQLSVVRCLPDHGFGGGLCVSTQPTRLSLYFKSGKLGDDDVMLQALAAMCD